MGVRPAWVDELHLIEQAPSEDASSLGLSLFHWAPAPLLDHFLLHALWRAQMSRTGDLAGLASQIESELCLAVLISPQAVGRWNLFPRARLSACLQFPPSASADQIVEKLAASGCEPETLALASTDGELAGQILGQAFPAAASLAEQGSAAARLNALAAALEEKQAAGGLLLSSAPGSPLLLTWVERL